MGKFVADGTKIYIGRVGATAPTPVTITAIAKVPAAGGAPDRVKVTAANTLSVGDFALLKGTGAPEIEGKLLEVSVASATEFEVDANPAAVTLGSTPTFTPYTVGPTNASDLMLACMVNMNIQTADAPSVEMNDLCDSSSVLGTTPPPTFSFAAWVDPEKEGFKNLVRAALAAPKPELPIAIVFPKNNGFIAGVGQVGSISTGATTGQGVQITGSGTFTSMPAVSWVL
jgi:hypothetical protein